MTPPLSLHSPETTGVIHHSMWLPSAVRGQRDGAEGGPAESGWLLGLTVWMLGTAPGLVVQPGKA